MSFTNQTPNYGLPQWIGTDKPTFLGDLNGAFSDIDTALKNNADASTAATATANSANATATSANTNANTALSTANSAASDAASAVSTAQSADTKATQALSAASGAETAAAANTIENLAPAYDNTLTYDVGDLVTFVDAQGHGRLYKCVVAVNSPMDFNINYWDDVTTSVVYAKAPLSALIDNTTNPTDKDMWLAIRDFIINIADYATKKIDVYTGVGGNYASHFHLNSISLINTNPTLSFSRTTGTGSSLSITALNVDSTNVTGNTTSINSSGQVTFTQSDFTSAATNPILVTVG